MINLFILNKRQVSLFGLMPQPCGCPALTSGRMCQRAQQEAGKSDHEVLNWQPFKAQLPAVYSSNTTYDVCTESLHTP